MSKFNTTSTRPAVASPVTTSRAPDAANHEGAAGHSLDVKSELFLLAVSNMVGQNTFYEAGSTRDDRYERLVRAATAEDPDWTAAFLRWLRGDGNMRSASLAGAASFAAERALRKEPGMSRQVIDSVLQRADEPGEMLAYWTSVYGRTIPKPVKRGIADAVARLYNERNLLKYDTDSKGFRFGDVIDLVHPSPSADWQGDLYRHALDRRHGRDNPIPESLDLLRNRQLLMSVKPETRRVMLDPVTLQAAGMTWEALAGWLQGPMDAKAWETVIPSMGYMACLAEGTPVWLADGTTAPIEEVVERRLPVLSYDKQWDTRPVRYGPHQTRDREVGRLVPTVPTAWLDMGVRPVQTVRFVSGRTVTATLDHRWVRARGDRASAWEWTTTDALRAGDRIPAPLTAGYFGDEGDALDGYAVGAMLGDGGMTAYTPEFHGDPNDGAVEFFRDYAAKNGLRAVEVTNGNIVRVRVSGSPKQPNALTELLRRYGVWGKRCEVKALPERPFSREFWIGTLSGLIDTDGCVREQRNAKGTLHGEVSCATVSARLAAQISDALLRLGVANQVRVLQPRSKPEARIQSRSPLHVVEVKQARAICRLASVLDLRISYKAARLASLSASLSHVAAAAGYDESVTLDRVASIDDAGEAATYCVTVEQSNLFVANGVVTGNCLRNLRNFDEAGVSDAVAETVAARLADPEQVARSRQFPFRFYAAHKAVGSLRWAHALEKALTASLANVPVLPGRTLVLVDQSPSMFPGYYGSTPSKGDITNADQAKLFGSAVALRAVDAELVGYGGTSYPVPFRKGDAVLTVMGKFQMVSYTDTFGAVARHYKGHDRVVIVTDEQNQPGQYRGLDDVLPKNVPAYTWNIAGFGVSATQSGRGTRHTFGGLTDHAFRMVPLLEAGRDASWPWDQPKISG